ncbi:hypothetical protein [Nitrospirillum amazonense]|nr:hypothetical protein [Nitrospirillum amazonense]
MGRVGTGYTVSVAEELFRRLERMRVEESPFDEGSPWPHHPRPPGRR